MSLVSALKAPLSIANAIRKASRATGVEFSYLLKTAARESSFNQGAKAKTSSASGLFQFIENTWLQTVKETGDRFGLGKYTAHIFKTRSGRHYVPNAELRTELLKLRNDPEVSALMAGAFTQQNSKIVASRLGREPSEGELYIAHFLGPEGASELISLAETKPNARASRHFPRAARANKSIFYSRGRSRTVAQVYNELVGDHVKLQAIAGAPDAAKPAAIRATKAIFTKPAPAPARLYTAALLPASASPVARESTPRTGHAATPGHGVTANRPIGLLGQTGSPIGAMTKVAALTPDSPKIAPPAMTGAATGSIGIWSTQIRYPAEQTARTEPGIKQGENEPSGNRQRAARRAKDSRPARLLEQSAKRHAMHQAKYAAIRTAPRRDAFNIPEFWERMAGN